MRFGKASLPSIGLSALAEARVSSESETGSGRFASHLLVQQGGERRIQSREVAVRAPTDRGRIDSRRAGIVEDDAAIDRSHRGPSAHRRGGAQLVEVLPAKEFGEEHIAGAINIPLKELDERAPRELERERPVIVYCNDYQ
jgi:hypothetical protein